MNGSDYHDPSKLQIITLENAIYIGMKNDLAFVIGTNLFLYEHQSTYNPNMPLRNLFYISSEYQKMVDSNKLYSSTLLEIPAPHFVVFYNGTTKQEDSWYNYLSDSYHNFSGIPDLELKVVTLNIIQVERMWDLARDSGQLCWHLPNRIAVHPRGAFILVGDCTPTKIKGIIKNWWNNVRP